MAKLIKQRDAVRHIVANDWKVLTLAAGEAPEDAKLPAGNVLLPLPVWRARKFDLLLRQWHALETFQLGVWLGPQDDPAALAGDLDDLSVIAIHFPVAGDGRGYSLATLLRTRLGYRGELRAFGAVGKDHLFFLKRVGFDAYDVNDPEAAIGGLDDFSVAYQAAANEPQPPVRSAALSA